MLVFEPFFPWSQLVVVFCILTVLVILVQGIRGYKKQGFAWSMLGGSAGTRWGVVVLTVMAAGLFAIAVLNPMWTDEPAKGGYHLEVAVDVSESVIRAEGGWEGVRRKAYKYISNSLDELPAHLRKRCSAGIITFRDHTVKVWGKDALESLPGAFMQLEESSFASGTGTDIEAGLREAGVMIGKTGEAGAVLLISDGNETRGQALKAAKELARQGIPVHIFPVTSQGPAIAITDADLPRQVNTNVETYVRGLLLNRFTNEQEVGISLSKDAPRDVPVSLKSEEVVVLPRMVSTEKQFFWPSGQWVRLRWPVIFDEFGLQFIDLVLTVEQGGRLSHQRRFFTYVKRAPRILAIGGDNRWMEGIPGDVAQIISIPADEVLVESDLKDIDAVIINSVPGSVLADDLQELIIKEVESRGMGLMLVNGEHEAAEDAETVILSYKKKPLDRILPVGGGPWPDDNRPPGRQVAIIIDTSGSMSTPMKDSGGKLSRIEKAREIAEYIIVDLLGPMDRLDIITFTTGAGHLVKDQLMDADGKQEALAQLDRIRPGGGTDPGRALMLLKERTMVNCGLIFISDGEFYYLHYRPDCRATVFEIDSDVQSKSAALQKIADPVPVGAFFNPASIGIPYFEKTKTRYFHRGLFQPLPMDEILPRHLRLPVPALDLEGTAVTHLKEGAILNGVRPKLTHPVLVFGESGAGTVGVFTTGIPYGWALEEKGREALKAWLARIIPFMDRDRYDFKLEDRGDSINIRVSLTIKSDKIPDIRRMTGLLIFSGEETVAINFQADDFSSGTFWGEIRVNRKDQPRRGILCIQESGPDALPRDQRIPIMIPPRSSRSLAPVSEANTYGQNRLLLEQIAQISGGIYNPSNPSDGISFFKENPVASKSQPLWPWLTVLAMACYLTAIALKRWNP